MRSLIFAPANRPDLVGKFGRMDADGCVIDLEDGTPRAEKDVARSNLKNSVKSLRANGLRSLLFVRVNQPSSPHYLSDLQETLSLDIDGIAIPKLEHKEQLFPVLCLIEQFGRLSGRAEVRPKRIIAGIESALGVVNVVALCASDPCVFAAYFGAHDFATDVGGRRTPSGDEVLYARSQVLLAARAAGIIAIDQAVAEVRDDAQFQHDAERGKDLGYDGKLCLLPRQVEIANRVFSPSAAEIEAAAHMVDAFSEAEAKGIGVIEVDGQMIDDGPLLRKARLTLALAEKLTSR